MRGGSGILTRNNFAGRANPARIFAGQARGGLARFATPTRQACPEQIRRGGLDKAHEDETTLPRGTDNRYQV